MPEKKAKVKKETDPAIKRIYDRYDARFLQRHGVKPLHGPNGAKHAALFKSMIATWKEPAVEKLVDDFLAGNDPWAVRCGWTVEALYNVAQRIMTRPQQADERSTGNRDAAQRATQRKS